ncbi:FeoA family protein [Natronogracilivirga saccharolytica]|uniref:Ferrous iron transport protein A n=1 Tax=Natronogracilivirga saccharolytica TaxID=2812953 RepID=A0A8J7RIH1_9BACT|nr:FeoA family protein [Natronogracilivirga saccharolytica]MBP3191235.1 ferrous iron transport protein A [Natronogracilivirga saccharolytica]
MIKTLIELNACEEAEIISLPDSSNLRHRLKELGIRQGKSISRISSQAAGGPVVVAVSGQQTAMSRELASSIKVCSKLPEHHLQEHSQAG